MTETVWNWRVLQPEERAALQDILDGGDWRAIHAGGSLHVDEYHIILGAKTYRFFLMCGSEVDALSPETEIEVGWETPAPSAVAPGSGLSDAQRRIHFDICRDGDRFASALERLDVAPGLKAELVNQVVALQRTAMVLNAPDRGLSRFKLSRF